VRELARETFLSIHSGGPGGRARGQRRGWRFAAGRRQYAEPPGPADPLLAVTTTSGREDGYLELVFLRWPASWLAFRPRSSPSPMGPGTRAPGKTAVDVQRSSLRNHGVEALGVRRDGRRPLPLGGFLGPDSDCHRSASAPGLGNQVPLGTNRKRQRRGPGSHIQRAVDLGRPSSTRPIPMEQGRFQGRSEVFARLLLSQPCRRPAWPASCVATSWRRSPGGWVEALCQQPRGLAAAPGGNSDRVAAALEHGPLRPLQEGPLLEGRGDLVDRQEVASLALEPGPRPLELIRQRAWPPRGNLPLASLQVQLFPLLAYQTPRCRGLPPSRRRVDCLRPLARVLLSDPGAASGPGLWCLGGWALPPAACRDRTACWWRCGAIACRPRRLDG